MMTASDELRNRLSSLLGEVDHRTDVSALRRRLASAGALTRRRLLDAAREFVQDPRVLEDEHSRVLVARVIAASTPDSLDVIRLVLTALPDGALGGELQFSLFVALSDVPGVLAASDRAAILDEVERFLASTRSDVAEASWMAGDLLGDHWPLAESLPVLLRLARTAEHPAGRHGAIHGLSHALARSTKPQQWSIMQSLQEVTTHDKDEAVRRYTKSIMGEARGL